MAAKLIVSTPKWKSDTVRGAGLQEVWRSIVRAGPRPAGPKLGICAWGERVRFLAKLCKHAEEHVAKARREMETVVAETNRMRGAGHAETEREAERAAKEDLLTQLYDASIGKLDTRRSTRPRADARPDGRHLIGRAGGGAQSSPTERTGGSTITVGRDGSVS